MTTARLRTRSHYPYGGAPGKDITTIRGFGSPGETVSLAFALEADGDVGELVVEAAELHGPGGPVALDVHVVGVWEQAGVGVRRGTPMRVPELLLKDDRVALEGRYVRGCGTPWHPHRTRVRYRAPRVRLDGPVRTALRAAAPKQLWLTARLPAGLAPGHYRGALRAGGAELAVELEVLDVRLAEPEQDLMLWYLGTLDCRRPQHYVRPDVFAAQLRDIFATGFRSLSLSETRPHLLQRAVEIAQEVGFRRAVVLSEASLDGVDFGALEPVVYASDELDGHGAERRAGHEAAVRAARARGVRSMASLLHAESAKGLEAPDVLSLYLPNNQEHFGFHAAFAELQGRDVRYHWQAHMEKPNVHRLLAGIYLHKSRASGIAPYCYQHLPQAPFSPFDDFDEWEPGFRVGAERRPFKDHMATYPARDGAIPTVQWRGLGEGLTDLRYLATLDRALETADPVLAGIVRERLAAALEPFSLTGVEVLSETATEPYPGVAPEAFQAARREVADAVVALTRSAAAPGA